MKNKDQQSSFSPTVLNSLFAYIVDVGEVQFVQEIIEEYKININNVTDKLGQTPLQAAISYGHFAIVKYLVEEQSANINAQNKKGETALHIAAKRKNLEIVKYLIEDQNADFNITDKFGYNALDIAKVVKAPDEIIKIFDEHVNEIEPTTPMLLENMGLFKPDEKQKLVSLVKENIKDIQENPFLGEKNSLEKNNISTDFTKYSLFTDEETNVVGNSTSIDYSNYNDFA